MFARIVVRTKYSRISVKLPIDVVPLEYVTSSTLTSTAPDLNPRLLKVSATTSSTSKVVESINTDFISFSGSPDSIFCAFKKMSFPTSY